MKPPHFFNRVGVGVGVAAMALTLPLVLTAPAPAQDAAPAPTFQPDAEVTMNFRDAELTAILDYLSEQAGLMVINNAEITDRVTVFSLSPVSVDGALDLLNSVLRDKGFTTIRRERLLRVVPLADAKKMSVPVRMGSDPTQMGSSDTVVTQIIPIRFADAEALATNLEPLVSADFAELSANASSNALIVTNTEANIRRIAEIVQALDSSITQVRDVRVFKLVYADADDTADLISEIFSKGPSDEDRVTAAIRERFSRGGRGGGRGGGGDRGGDGGDAAEAGNAAGTEVTAAADERTNSVVVSADPEVMDAIEQMLSELDTDTAAKEAVLVYRAKNTTAVELESLFGALFLGQSISRDTGSSATSSRTGTTTQTLRQNNTGNNNTGNNNAGNNNARGNNNGGGNNAAASAGTGSASDLVNNVTAVADEATNSLLVLTAEVNFPRIEAILEELDRPVPQVLVRVLVAELTHEKGSDIGTQFALRSEPEGNGILNTITSFGAPATGLSLGFVDTDFSATITALETTGVLDVLSRPYILTRDNQEANILVGEEVPFVTNSRTTDTGNVINTIEYRDIGIILGVTPQINDEGLVVLTVSQELSSLQTSTVQISEGLSAQRVAKRTADTRIAVVDGQTVVIGGLMQERLTEDVSKVPLLGDLPLIGGLFRRTIENRAKTELLLFLTPEVVMQPDGLEALGARVRAETEEIEHTVAPGALQRHLDRLKGIPSPRDQEPLLVP